MSVCRPNIDSVHVHGCMHGCMYMYVHELCSMYVCIIIHVCMYCSNSMFVHVHVGIEPNMSTLSSVGSLCPRSIPFCMEWGWTTSSVRISGVSKIQQKVSAHLMLFSGDVMMM